MPQAGFFIFVESQFLIYLNNKTLLHFSKKVYKQKKHMHKDIRNLFKSHIIKMSL